MREDKKIYQIFNRYFTNVTKGLRRRQADKFQFFENETNYRLIKKYYGDENFSFNQYLKIASKEQLTLLGPGGRVKWGHFCPRQI